MVTIRLARAEFTAVLDSLGVFYCEYMDIVCPGVLVKLVSCVPVNQARDDIPPEGDMTFGRAAEYLDTARCPASLFKQVDAIDNRLKAAGLGMGAQIHPRGCFRRAGMDCFWGTRLHN